MITNQNTAQPTKQPAPKTDTVVYTPEQRKARVEAYLKLVQLGAAPSVTFDEAHDALYADVYAQATKDVEQQRYDDIIKYRKVLDLGTGWDQMNVPEPAAVKGKRWNEAHKGDKSNDALVIGGDNRVRTPEDHAAAAPSGYIGTKSVDDSGPTKGGVMTTKNFGG